MTALTPLSYSRIPKQKKQSLLQSGDCKIHERTGVSCIRPRSLDVVDAYARCRVCLSVCLSACLISATTPLKVILLGYKESYQGNSF